MVDLPKIPRRLVTSEAPKSLVTAADIAKPYEDYGRALTGLGDAIGDVAVVEAENAAEKAVTRDADGNISVNLMPDFTGRAGRAYNRIAKQDFLIQFEQKARQDLTDKQIEFDGRPDQFKAWADTYKAGTLEKEPNDELAKAKSSVIDKYAEQAHRGLLIKKHHVDLTRANESTNAKLETLADDLERLTRQGAPKEVVDSTIKEFDGLLNEKVNNPLIAYPQEKADQFRDAVMTRAHTGAILEGVERVYSLPPDQGGGYQAAKAHLNDSVNSLGATVKDSAKIQRAGDAWLNAQEKALQGDRDQVSKEWSAARPQLSTLPAEALDDLEQRATTAGAWRVASDIKQRRAALDFSTQVSRLPRSEQLKVLSTGVLPDPLRMGGTPLEIAQQFKGLDERANRGTIAAFIQKAGGQKLDPVSTAWCAAWLNAIMRASGRPGTDSNMAKSFLNYGAPTDQPTEGDIAVLPRGDPSGPYGHVGLVSKVYQRGGQTFVSVLGGNTGNKVAEAEYPIERVLGFRKPPAAGSSPLPAAAPNDAPAAVAQNVPNAPNAPAVAPVAGAVAAPAAAPGAAPPAEQPGFSLTQDRPGLLALNAVRENLRKDLTERIRDFTTADRKLELPSVAEMASLAEEVGFLGTPDQKRQVAELGAQAEYGAEFRQLSAPKRAEVIAAWDTKLQEGGDKFARDLKAKLDHSDETIRNEFKRDPYGAQYQFGVGTQPLAALDFKDPAQMQAVLAEKVKQQATIRASQEVGAFSAFRPAEAESFRGFLGTATAEQVAGAFAALRKLDDETLFETLSDKPVADGVRAAMRSTDPAKYTAVMSNVDAIYARGPEQTSKLLGDEGKHDLFTWQSNRRYMDAETLTKDRQRSADPQVSEQQKVAMAKGQELARKKKPADVVAGFDDSFGITPGVIARNVTGTQPLAPVDAETINTLMGDYETVFERRYADTRDPDTAHTQTIDFLKDKWSRSEINGGRLMLRAPERVYPAIDGSYDWMKKQVEDALTQKFGARVPEPILSEQELKGGPLQKPASWDYVLVSDRTTEAEAQRFDKSKPISDTNRAPSYVVVVRNNLLTRPEWNVVTRDGGGGESRFSFDPGPDQARSDAQFLARDVRHERVLQNRNYSGVGGM
jgi:uncharacterized protein (TIGR02594 family)